MTSARFLLLLVLLLGWFAPAEAQLGPRENAMAVSLLPETARVPAGGAVELAIRMRPKPGWHGYWKNPGEAGVEDRIDWDLPANVTVGPLRYPVPDTLRIAGLMNHVYKGEYALLARLEVPEGMAPGTRLPIRARLEYLVCTDEICVPERASVATMLTVGPAGASAARSQQFDQWRSRLPAPAVQGGRFERQGDRLRLALPYPEGAPADAESWFFPLTDGAIDYSAPQVIGRNGDTLVIDASAGRSAGDLRQLEGVLRYGEGRGISLSLVPGPVPLATTMISAPAAQDAAGSGAVLAALLGAVVGGLLLNVMPCVFPILSLKALSLARAGETQVAARREALAYAAGAVVTCLALGALLLALRAGGEAVGWAFQLQDPRVILILLLLVTAIALNLAGLFELPAFTGGSALAGSGGTRGAFWTGALAAFVATPCTGPFMGVALGTALILPAAASLAVFAGLGLGLALPFLLLGFMPSLRRLLPKPGPWMARLRRILSVPMFLTALGLAWILGRQAGVDGMALGLGAALAVGLGLWWMGRRQGRGSLVFPLAPALIAATAAILLVPGAVTPAAAGMRGPLAGEPFSEARLAALRAEGRPVFVYFTADWCVTCKVNERGVLARDAVAQDFAREGVAVLRGDWTRGDAEIGRFLEKHGRSGVPLYLYYAPGEGAEILPQVLTTGRLVNLS